jgi:hypothetical protein
VRILQRRRRRRGTAPPGEQCLCISPDPRATPPRRQKTIRVVFSKTRCKVGVLVFSCAPDLVVKRILSQILAGGSPTSSPNPAI